MKLSEYIDYLYESLEFKQCPIEVAFMILGKKWSAAILKELLRGVSQFNRIEENLDGGWVWVEIDAGETSQLDLSEPMPNFSLEDKNPMSLTLGEYYSPRYFLEKVSGWYFSHST